MQIIHLVILENLGSFHPPPPLHLEKEKGGGALDDDSTTHHFKNFVKLYFYYKNGITV